MVFIKAEEFLKQPEEVQKVFLEWWKPSIGDLISINVCTENGKDEDMIFAINSDSNEINKLKDIPLFTEGQLRQFIEDKTKDKYDILYSFGLKKYISFYKYTENENKATYEVDNHDLLKAYWEVAIKVSSK